MPYAFPILLTLLLFLGNVLHSAKAAAIDYLTLDDSQQQLSLGKHIKLLEDPSNELTLNEILNNRQSLNFVKGTRDTHSFGFTNSTYWLELAIENHHDRATTWILELGYPLVDTLNVFVLDPKHNNRPINVWQTGDKQPFASREIPHHNFAFTLNLEARQQRLIYLSVQSGNTMALPLKLYNQRAYIEYVNSSTIGLGLYYGIMLVMLLYNGFLYLSIRDRSYLYYVLYLGFFATTMLGLNGIAFAHLWPDSPWLANHAPPTLAALASLCGLLFARHFLRLDRTFPQIRQSLNIMIWVEILLIIFAAFADHAITTPTVFPLQLIALMIILVAGVQSLRSGYRPARFYLLAWAGFIFGCTLRLLLGAGFVPSNFITEYGVQIGSALEVVLLSLALADRINRIQLKANKNALLAKENALKAKANAEKANRAKTLFVADVSHEIRTPLNAVLGYSQMLEQDPSINAAQKEKLAVIERSGQHLLGVINNILDLSKLEAGAQELTPSDNDLVSQIKDIILMLTPHCQAKDISLQFDYDGPEVLPLHIDIGKLRQVLINLIGNATKFTTEGKIRVELSVKPDNVYDFAVIDTGCGIEAEQQQKIFEAFGQTEQGEKAGGTGLGLAIAAKLVALMGGSLQLKSKPGEGSRFYFSLIIQPARKPIGVVKVPQSRQVRIAPKQKATAMVVEDIQESAQMLEQLLQSAGLEVVMAANGREALAKLSDMATLPQILFIDIRMPIMDGIETLEQIKKRYSDAPPCIAVSANALAQDIQAYKDRGFAEYITKPFRFERIYQCLQQFLTVEFVQAGEQPNNKPQDAQSSVLTIPIFFHKRLMMAAQNYEITLFEECLQELTKHSSHGERLSNELKPYLAQYDMEAVQQYLDKVATQ